MNIFPTSDVLLSRIRSRIESAFPRSHDPKQSIMVLKQQPVIRKSPAYVSRYFPTIKLQVAHSPNDIYDIEALLDSGASALYVSKDFIEDHDIPTRPLFKPLFAYNADDTINDTKITHEAKLICHFKGHVSSEWFYVTDIGNKTMIIGMTWLRSHNPEINWRSGEISFSRCPSTCQGKKSITSVLQSLLDQAPTMSKADYESQFLNRIYHSIAIKETQSQRWAMEEMRKNLDKVLTLKDIEKGPFKEYADIFTEANYQELPPHRKFDHKIDFIPGWEDKLWKPHIYPLGFHEQKELDKQIKEGLASGRIRRSESPIASPVFFVAKKTVDPETGEPQLRMVIDYRKLNEITVKNKYPLPRIDELIQKWKGCLFFSALDIRSGYYNIRMREDDEWKTAFITNRGLFESLVMTFGLTNAPATFQTMMDEIFIVQIRRGDTSGFIDDLTIATGRDPQGILEPEEFHIKVLKEIFQVCREQKLYLKPEKCLLMKKEILSLGHLVSGNDIRPDPVKVSGIKDWPVPKNVSQVRSFLGTTGYYRRFIKNYSMIARPLNDLLKKDAIWQWESPQQEAYETLKTVLLTEVFLVHPDNEKQFLLETDASLFAWGAVLSQQDDNGKWRPVGMVSKGFADAETRYDTHDRELLAIIRALQEFRHWLISSKYPIIVLTDHNNLRYFRTKQFLSPRQSRWTEFISHYDLTFRYRPGKQSSLPDRLSRRADHIPEEGIPPDESIVLPEKMFKDEHVPIATLWDPYAKGIPIPDEPLEKSDQTEFIPINSMWIPEPNEDTYERKIYIAQSQDPLIQGFNKTKESDPLPKGWTRHEELWTYFGKIYIPQQLRQEIFRKLHVEGPAAHPGIRSTISSIANDYYWPQLRQNINEWVKNCDVCQRMKIRNQKPHGTLKPIDPTPRPWGVVTTDLITGLPLCQGYDAIWTATDKRGKIKHIAPTVSTLDTAGFAKLFLEHVWKHHGTSDKIISDRGPQMSSRSFKDICAKLGVELALSTAYHPQTDGQSERTNQEVEQALRTVVSYHQDDWVDWIPIIEFALNNRYHTGLKTTPFYANYGYHPQIGSLPRVQSAIESVDDFVKHIHEVQKQTSESLVKAAEDMKKFYDRHRNKTPEFEVGQKVLLDNSDLALNRPSRKLSEKYSGPFEIIEKVGTHAYRLKLPLYWKNVHSVFNVSKLFPYREDPENPNFNPPPPDVIEGEPEWEVEEILDAKFDHGKLLFLVKWLGWPSSENSWEDESNLENAPEIISDFYRKFPGAPKRLPSGKTTGKSVTQRRRKARKRIAGLDFQPLDIQTNVETWPTGHMF